MLGYALELKGGTRFLIDNSEEIDGNELRDRLLSTIEKQWSKILLSSAEIEEIDEEADMEYMVIRMDEELNLVDEIGSFKGFGDWIGVHSIRSTCVLERSHLLTDFIEGNLDRAVEVTRFLDEESEDFHTETEVFVIFNTM